MLLRIRNIYSFSTDYTLFYPRRKNSTKRNFYKSKIHSWIYGLELWGCAGKSNISIIQRSQSKILRMIVDAPWYVCNATLHANLGIRVSYVHEVIHQKCNKHHTRLGTHENPLLKTLLLREDNRLLKRNWLIDLI
jgi:hypothetical protein